MSKRKFVAFEAVKAAVNVTQVLQHYGLADQFKKSNNGDTWSGPCPIHKGTNPTQFRVSVSKNCWHCFSGDCNAHGNVLELVARLENISVTSAAIKLADWFKVDAEWKPDTGRREKPARSEERESMTREPTPSHRAGVRPAAKRSVTAEQLAKAEEIGSNKKLNFALQNLDAAHPYLIERGLSPETITEFGIGYCAKGVMAGRIAIPIHNAAGELVAYCGRWPGEPDEDTPKYKLPAGFRKSLELFNLHRAVNEAPGHPLIIVEGYFDVLKLAERGVPRVVALMGSTLSPAQEELIRKHTRGGSQVILLLDEDDAGRAGRTDIVQRLARFVFVKAPAFEKEGQQPEDLSAEEITALIGGAW
jgi:DNA primase